MYSKYLFCYLKIQYYIKHVFSIHEDRRPSINVVLYEYQRTKLLDSLNGIVSRGQSRTQSALGTFHLWELHASQIYKVVPCACSEPCRLIIRPRHTFII